MTEALEKSHRKGRGRRCMDGFHLPGDPGEGGDREREHGRAGFSDLKPLDRECRQIRADP